jgi:hypothetical protein
MAGKLTRWVVLAAVAGLGWMPADWGQDGRVAGARPDMPVTVSLGPVAGNLSNAKVEAGWSGQSGSLCCLTFGGAGAAEVLRLDNLFTLELGPAGVLRASDLTVKARARVETLAGEPSSSRLAERIPGLAVHYALAAPNGSFTADWALVMRAGSGYVRQVLTITAGSKALNLSDVRMIDVRIPDVQGPGVEVAGTVKGSPLLVGDFFLGFEEPLSESSVVGERAVSELHRGVALGAGQSATFSAVIGLAEPGQMRRSFLTYLERERAHPYRTFLHYNSWFDIGFFTPYTQADALDRIHAIGEELHDKRGVVLDSFLLDDGWDDHGDLWKIRSDFKGGFEPLQQAAAQYGTAIGVWLSPWGGYGPPKQERLAAARRDGYETVNGGLALSGPKYYARFHDAVTEMVTKYGINQFKLDGTGNADQVVKGSAFSSDFDAAIHLIEDLRRLKPDLYVNLTTGTYPSPFWLMYADSIWRGGEDTDFAGVGTSRERWITYRDADTYDEVVKAGRLFPLNSLMLHGLVYAQKAPHLSDDPGDDFKNEVRSYFGSGTQLQEMYITPGLLKATDWDVLAEAAKWSRQNAMTLKDTHWIGGDPRWLEVYGWAAWSPEMGGKGIVTLRNPSDQAQEFTLEIGSALELPASAARHYSARSPWADGAGLPAMEFKAGEPQAIRLAPFEVKTLELSPKVD